MAIEEIVPVFQPAISTDGDHLSEQEATLFTLIKNMERHFKQKHMKISKLDCPECEKKFPD